MSEILTPLERKGKHIVGYMTPETAKVMSSNINKLLSEGVEQIQLALFFDDGKLILSEDLFRTHFVPN
jgi:hypothetical protein